MFSRKIQIQTKGRGSYNVSRDIQQVVAQSGLEEGLCHVFIHHTSASLILCENADPDVRADLERYMAHLVKDGDPMFAHQDEGKDDMAAHIRTILTSSSLTIPVANGRCDLGTWQGVFVWEHRYDDYQRTLTISVVD
jgi:secondary thiamine-phosphate synthase enzyme